MEQKKKSKTGGDLLVMTKITKEFPGVKALNGVSLNLKEGEILALCGENGAGKSTLMKVLSGLYASGTYTGDIYISGQLQEFRHIRDSEKAGVAIIHQELSLIPEMTIGENVFIGREPSNYGIIDWNKLYSDSRAICESIGLMRNPRRKVKQLGVGQQQLVEIAKALSQDPRILVLDEPTSALSETEVKNLLEVLRSLKARGVSCILISHKLDEVLEVADRITVLRDGTAVSTFDKASATQGRIVSEMVGRELSDYFPKTPRKLGETVFELKNLTVRHPTRTDKFILDDISFAVKKGEILGIAGLMGAGRSELLLSIFGVFPGKPLPNHQLVLNGKLMYFHSPHGAIQHGLALLPEDRKRLGLLLDETVVHNMTLAALSKFATFGIVDGNAEMEATQEKVKSLKIKTPSVTTVVKNLSGGNQQKVVLGKCLLTSPQVLFLDEPTRGIDVGAKAEIYRLINELAAGGLAVVMASSELPEILGMSDRILVMSEGRIAAEFDVQDANQEKLMAAATSFR
jgi:D-xylose transport system ATP-binding protein